MQLLSINIRKRFNITMNNHHNTFRRFGVEIPFTSYHHLKRRFSVESAEMPDENVSSMRILYRLCRNIKFNCRVAENRFFFSSIQPAIKEAFTKE